MLPMIAALALIAEDDVALRAAARDAAPVQAHLYRGEWLEIRGQSGDFLQVYDYQRERPGYVRRWQTREVHLDDPNSIADLRTIVLFVRDSPGMESLGIGCAALFLKSADAKMLAQATDVYDAIGVMAERLARRASVKNAAMDQRALTLANHLEVVNNCGIRFTQITRDDRTITCYDGDAHRRILATKTAKSDQIMRAALALTSDTCVDPTRTTSDLLAWNLWRLEMLERVDTRTLAPFEVARVYLRRAQAHAWLAFLRGRIAGDTDQTRANAAAALDAMVHVNRRDLVEEDLPLYDETAVRVGASRRSASLPQAQSLLSLVIENGQPGESCMVLRKADTTVSRACTYGVVWPRSFRVAPTGDVAVVSVQPSRSWTELWVFQRAADASWKSQALFATTEQTEIGYVEGAGFSSDGKTLLVAKESFVGRHAVRRFEVLDTATLRVERFADSADALGAFKRWSSPGWRGESLVLR